MNRRPRHARTHSGLFGRLQSPWMPVAALLAALSTPAMAQAPAAEPPPPRSQLDGRLLEQLLDVELAARQGQWRSAFDVLLDAGRRTRDEGLFRRAFEMALAGRSADHALQATRAWRQVKPDAVEAVRLEVHVLLLTQRLEDLGETLRQLLRLTPPAERSALIAGLPRFLSAPEEKSRVLAAAQHALAPFVDAAGTRVAARAALARLSLAADLPDDALTLTRKVLAEDPRALDGLRVALELMNSRPEAEALVMRYLDSRGAALPVRVAYAQQLSEASRLVEAGQQLRRVVAEAPDMASAWFTLGGTLLQIHQPQEAEAALRRYLSLSEKSEATAGEATATAADPELQETPTATPRQRERIEAAQDQARLWLAQALEQRRQPTQAQAELDLIPRERWTLEVVTRRAQLQAGRGELEAALRMVRETPVKEDVSPRHRVLAQVQVLREAKQWQRAYDLLLGLLRETPEDSGVTYELAMTAERLQRLEDMEVLLRRVISLKPDDASAFNALGYSLADRNLRLEEAESLLQRAIKLSPADPYIIDSLGWVNYRLGRLQAARELLEKSIARRPHAEVGAHLGEVLWQQGHHAQALERFRQAQAMEPDNEVLQETLKRLQVRL
ncbi:tetratricopeptide repeat protein [Ideonella livida]|uniref:Tetratricopeptide repeat protein n=1 Tax=Ideonella livida TaxID=2707176 RepID=A0A7C9TL07_9BURK|nr:tetratricopeptide repeat protein [Ideonella livida]NDY92262.1 tetratricopeptide repeat protein [Ideonella livida]